MGARWGLRARVLAAAAAIAAAAVITFGLLLAAIADERDAADLSRASAETLADAGALERLAGDLETGGRGYILTRQRQFLAPHVHARAPPVPRPSPHRARATAGGRRAARRPAADAAAGAARRAAARRPLLLRRRL